MPKSPSYLTLQLAPGQLMHLPVACSTTLEVTQGRVWITRCGDLHDHFLETGDSLRVAPGAGTLLGAETEAAVAVAGSPSLARRWGGPLFAGLWRLLRRARSAGKGAEVAAG